VLAVCLAPVAHCPAQATGQSPGSEEHLKRFLQKYDGNPSSAGERTTRYAAAFLDLKDDGKEQAIVYLIGPRWCGSGGCSCLILMPEGESYKVVTKTTITQLPIRVLATKTNGWHDLGVWVQGGGIQPGYEARLRFNGKKYPSNPSVPPAQRVQKGTAGKVVIPDSAQGRPLFGD